MLNDLLILRKIKEGNIKAFEGLFRQYYSSLYLYALSITNRKDISEEIVQELFYTLWKEKESIQIYRSLKSYLYKAVRNQSLQYHERTNVENRHKEKVLSSKTELEDNTPQEEIEYKELEDVVNKTLKKLPERRLKIFKMHRMEGKKYKEIAELLSVSIKTVEAEMSKTYSQLRHEIEKYKQVL